MDTVSVLIVTYNSAWEKLKMTLKSIIIQRDINIQIVVADDGSIENHFDKVRIYLKEKRCDNYKLVTYEKNQGTVMNVYNGLLYCTGKYVKTISPGDFLAGETVLSDWVKYMKKSETDVSFCDAYYYTIENGHYISVKTKSHPQSHKTRRGYDLIRHYLLLDDIVTGAAVLCERKIMQSYLKLIKGKIIYAEDNIYRIMAADKSEFSFWKSEGIYYEFGTGISTNNQNIWSERLENDWNEANKIILENAKPEIKKILSERFALQGNLNRMGRMRYFLLRPSMLPFYIKKKVCPRMTHQFKDESYIKSLIE